jgi:Na+/proline symporter
VVVFGVIVTAMAFAVPYMGDLILSIALGIFGMVGGPICGVVASGLFLPFVNSWVRLHLLGCVI